MEWGGKCHLWVRVVKKWVEFSALFFLCLFVKNYKILWDNEATQKEGKLPAVQEHLYLTEREHLLYESTEVSGIVCHDIWYYPKNTYWDLYRAIGIFVREKKSLLNASMWYSILSSVWRKYMSKGSLEDIFGRKRNVFIENEMHLPRES